MADILERREEIARFGLRWRVYCLRRMRPIQIGISKSFDTWHRAKYTDTIQIVCRILSLHRPFIKILKASYSAYPHVAPLSYICHWADIVTYAKNMQGVVRLEFYQLFLYLLGLWLVTRSCRERILRICVHGWIRCVVVL